MLLQTLLMLLALLLVLLFLLLRLFLLLLLLLLLLLAVYTESATDIIVASMAARVASTDIADVQTPFCLDIAWLMQMAESLREEQPSLPFSFPCSRQKWLG